MIEHAKDPAGPGFDREFTGNKQHLRWLQLGPGAWDEWRRKYPDQVPQLSQADLEHADLGRADLRGANLVAANLQAADLVDADLEEAYLEEANLRGAWLNAANLSGARLRDANLEGADLRHANLAGADLSGATLEGADLRGAIGVRLSENFIRNARFSARAKDPWSRLRRSYTGPRLLLNTLFLLLFFVPYFLKAAGWYAVSRGQEELQLAASGLAEVAATLEPGIRTPAEALLQSAETNLPPDSCVQDHPRWQCSRVWRVLVGLDRDADPAGRLPGWLYWTTAVLLILYNFLRWGLTLVVAPMRDAEERSGVSPTHGGVSLDSYGWLVWPHRVTQALFWVAVLSFLLHAPYWLTRTVWLPVA